MPEAKEIPPELPPVSEPSDLSRKPDYGLFLTLISLLFGVLIPVLQMNSLEINWGWSAIVYSGITLGGVWTFLSHAAPHRSNFFRILGSLAIMGVQRQYHKEHSPPIIPPPNPEVMKQFTNQDLKTDGILRALTTNPVIPSVVSLPILDTENEKIKEQQKQLAQTQKIISETPVGLESLRAGRHVASCQTQSPCFPCNGVPFPSSCHRYRFRHPRRFQTAAIHRPQLPCACESNPPCAKPSCKSRQAAVPIPLPERRAAK